MIRDSTCVILKNIINLNIVVIVMITLDNAPDNNTYCSNFILFPVDLKI